MSRLPGTPPPSVYQVTHGTALQAAECYVMHHVMVLPSRQRSACEASCDSTALQAAERYVMHHSPYARCPFRAQLHNMTHYPGCRFALPWAMSLQPLLDAW